MTLHLDHPTLALDAGQVLSLDDAAGTRVSPRDGPLWVTYEDSIADVIVAPGESVVLSRNGRTVLQALHPTRVSLQ